jgi:Cdc6-like AAA superfamily ATPase
VHRHAQIRARRVDHPNGRQLPRQCGNRGGPIVEGELPLGGSLFAGQVPPVVTSPTFAICKKALSIFTLDQYVDAAIMTRKHGDTIKAAVKTHRNILVTGGTGSGKTTLVNAIRKMRFTIKRSFARTLSRTAQSTLTLFRKLSASSWATFFNVSSPSSRTDSSFSARES